MAFSPNFNLAHFNQHLYHDKYDIFIMNMIMMSTMMMVFAEGNSSNVMNVLMKLVFDSFNLDEDDDSDDCQYICKGIRVPLR